MDPCSGKISCAMEQQACAPQLWSLRLRAHEPQLLKPHVPWSLCPATEEPPRNEKLCTATGG